jgi:hypothetical protein
MEAWKGGRAPDGYAALNNGMGLDDPGMCSSGTDAKKSLCTDSATLPDLVRADPNK